MKKIFWIAGEKSGDLHSSIVLKELQLQNKEYQHVGIGGPLMRKFGLKPMFPFDRFAVMGFIEVVKHLFFFVNVEKKIRQLFRENPPDLVVLVDYPGLNMRIAQQASKLGIPVLYFISPQFWAWKFKRIFKLKKLTDHLAYILPFEGKYFDKFGVKSTYVGHPIAQEIEIKINKKEFAEKYNIDSTKQWIGFLPGSRDNELKKLLPQYLAAIKELDNGNFEFLISRANSVSESLFNDIIKKSGISNCKVIHDNNYEMMKHTDILVVTSGTATLETAYIGTPFIIAYKTSKISYELGKRFIKIDRIGLPNIVLDKDIVPELIQNEVNGKSISKNILAILSSETKYNQIKKELQNLHDILGSKKTSEEMVKLIEEMLNE
ncbi:MAG: lipid-A-disaccharide synthase [Candidatus Cloacimonadota bacterium]|nr:MAG: lipid-A-disaccharide synthase [Candidatus Cloacimonadota bacterium]